MQESPKNLRGIEGAAEISAAEAALLGHQKRRERILAVGRGIGREIRRQAAACGCRSLELGEIDASGRTRGQRIAVFRAAEPFDALADGGVELIDALERVGKIAVRPRAKAAQPIVGERSRPARRFALSLREEKAGEREIALARAQHRIREARVAVRPQRPVLQRFKLRRSRRSPGVAARRQRTPVPRS